MHGAIKKCMGLALLRHARYGQPPASPRSASIHVRPHLYVLRHSRVPHSVYILWFLGKVVAYFLNKKYH